MCIYYGLCVIIFMKNLTIVLQSAKISVDSISTAIFVL